MRVPVSWIRELVELPAAAGVADLSAAYTSAGLTVERVDLALPPVSGPLVVGRVVSKSDEPQRNGKTIAYCRVDVGPELGEPSSDAAPPSVGIVCGAHNFAPGDLVVVALPGTVLPGGFEISARKTYGHISNGMICSERELGLGDDHDGIMVLEPGSGVPGDGAADLLWTADEILDIEVTPNLAHCLSVRGLAREAAQAFAVSYADPYARPTPTPAMDGHPVLLESDRCPVFVALTVEGFDPLAPAPRWLASRLEHCGMRSVSVAVDVTNYVMLESGQPLHAYDAAKLSGPIVVRTAREGERLETLDHVVRDLDPDDLLITDDSGPIGIAGVMGGAATEVCDQTDRIVLEAAHFAQAGVSRSFRRHQIPSEASKRFERGVDPALPHAAAVRAANLLVELAGGRVLDAETIAGEPPSIPSTTVRAGLFPAVLGAPVGIAEAVGALERGGVSVIALGDSLTLTPPPWRPDLRDPNDYVEEVGAKIGYDRIGRRMPVAPAGRGLTPAQRRRRASLRAVQAAGFTEVITLPFIGSHELDQLGVGAEDPRRETVRLANPLADNSPFLRTTLLPGLFAAVRRNKSRSLDDLALFEQGACFRDAGTMAKSAPRPGVEAAPGEDVLAAIDDALPAQPHMIAAVLTGDWRPADWSAAAEPATWRHAVAFAETLAGAIGARLTRRSVEQAPWHPGRCAELSLAGTVLGHVGELHPSVCEAAQLPGRACAVELDLGVLVSLAPDEGRIGPLWGFPLAKEDVALVVDEDVPAAAVEDALREGAGELLESIALFDVYTGPQAGPGKKSLAFALRFRADRTLTDSEAGQARDAAAALAESRFGALRRA